LIETNALPLRQATNSEVISTKFARNICNKGCQGQMSKVKGQGHIEANLCTLWQRDSHQLTAIRPLSVRRSHTD